MNKLVFIGFAFQHHKGTHAGYHHIKEYVNYDYIVDCQSFIEKCNRPSKNIINHVWRYMMFLLTGFPCFPIYFIKLLKINYSEDNVVFHFIYGENLYTPLLKVFLRKRNKIVCTFHQPFEWFDNRIKWRKRLNKIDKVILMSDKEICQFESLVGKDKVYYIPHGICTDFYKLNDKRDAEEPVLLTVGNWLRDYKIANEVYKKVLCYFPKLKIYVVAAPKSTEPIECNERIICLSGISDEELRQLYWSCNVLYLPLVRYTANNALLEAGASGCNIVIASDSTDNSYIPSEYIQEVGLNVDDSVNAIIRCMTNDKNNQLALYVDANFSWNVVGRNAECVLRTT